MKTDINKTPDAQKPEATTLDAEPCASAADEDTYIKIPSCPLRCKLRGEEATPYRSQYPNL